MFSVKNMNVDCHHVTLHAANVRVKVKMPSGHAADFNDSASRSSRAAQLRQEETDSVPLFRRQPIRHINSKLFPSSDVTEAVRGNSYHFKQCTVNGYYRRHIIIIQQ